MKILIVSEMATDLAYEVEWAVGEDFDRYVNDNKDDTTKKRVGSYLINYQMSNSNKFGI